MSVKQPPAASRTTLAVLAVVSLVSSGCSTAPSLAPTQPDAPPATPEPAPVPSAVPPPASVLPASEAEAATPDEPPPSCGARLAIRCGLKEALHTCADGSLYRQACAYGCEEGHGCLACRPGERRCAPGAAIACSDDGHERKVTACDAFAGERCFDGECSAACTGALGSVAGCEFFAVPLPNADAATGDVGFALAIQNTTAAPNAVVVEGGALANGEPVSLRLEPGEARTVALPWVTLTRDEAISMTKADATYVVRSAAPIVVHQINGLSGRSPGRGDGTLLLPVPGLGTRYLVAGVPAARGAKGAASPSVLTIVAVADETDVSLATSTPIVPTGTLEASGGVVRLHAGELLQVVTDHGVDATQALAADLSGSEITATKPVLALASSPCAAHDGAPQCAHVEEIQLPAPLLGTTYQATPFAADTRIRIVASEDGTILTTEPPLAGTPTTLARGEVLEAPLPESTRVSASSPVHVLELEAGPGGATMGLAAVPPLDRLATELYVPLFGEASTLVLTQPQPGAVTLRSPDGMSREVSMGGGPGSARKASEPLCTGATSCTSGRVVSSRAGMTSLVHTSLGATSYATFGGLRTDPR